MLDRAAQETVDLKAAEAAFAASDTLDNLAALEVAEKAFFAKLAALKAEWNGLAISDQVRMSAELNASETEGTAVDEIYYLQIAIASAETLVSYGEVA